MDRVQSLTQAYSQAPWRKQLQIIGAFLLILVGIALVAGIYLNVTARAATIGRDIQAMQGDIEDLQLVNANLQSQLAFLTSEGVMEKRAEDLGFQPMLTDETMFILVPGYSDRQPAILAPAPSPVDLGSSGMPAEYTELIFIWLRKQFLTSSFSFLR